MKTIVGMPITLPRAGRQHEYVDRPQRLLLAFYILRRRYLEAS